MSPQSFRVLIPDGEFPHALKAVRCLARSASLLETQNPVSIHLCTGSEIPHLLRFSRHVDEIHPIPLQLPKWERAQMIADVARKIGADLIFPVSVEGNMLFAKYRELFGGMASTPISDLHTQRTADDKGLLVELMEKRGISHPPAVRLRPMPGLQARLKDVPFPVLVKATVGQGGKHIYRFEKPDDVLHFAKQEAEDDREYIVQSFVEGTDIDYSVLAVEGTVVAYTIQQALVSARHRHEFGPPEHIQFLGDPNVEAIGRSLIEALGFSGLAHIDLRYDTERQNLYVLEINARIWGSLLGSLRAGVNFPALACRAGLGRPLPAVEYEKIRYCVVGDLGIKRLWRAHRREIPLRNSCLTYAVDDPLPDLMELARLKWEWAKRLVSPNKEEGKDGRPESLRGNGQVRGTEEVRPEVFAE